MLTLIRRRSTSGCKWSMAGPQWVGLPSLPPSPSRAQRNDQGSRVINQNKAASPRVLLIAEHASAYYGGEAILPLHYFMRLRERGVECWMISHVRARVDLLELLPSESDRLFFTPDTGFNKLAHRLTGLLPARLGHFSIGFLSRIITQVAARRIAKRLIREHAIDVVHQPIPVSPKESSLVFGVGAPVIIGPMNGGMTYPPGFRNFDGRFARPVIALGRFFAPLAHRIFPGKPRAKRLLVANERSRQALPARMRERAEMLVENGVDMDLWRGTGGEKPPRAAPAELRFIYMGRLVNWKCVDILLEAFAAVSGCTDATLTIIGDGLLRENLETQCRRLGIESRVKITGWLPQEECATQLSEADALVLPSVHECGGAVVLEAMAAGVPVIAADWGGPADYLDDSCGILVSVASRQRLKEGLTSAMLRLSGSPDLRRQLGDAGRQKAAREFDWERKVDKIIEIYSDVIAAQERPDSLLKVGE